MRDKLQIDMISFTKLYLIDIRGDIDQAVKITKFDQQSVVLCVVKSLTGILYNYCCGIYTRIY